MNPHQMMLNFCRQHFQTNEKMDIYFGYRKRICQNCGLPNCRKILDINIFYQGIETTRYAHVCEIREIMLKRNRRKKLIMKMKRRKKLIMKMKAKMMLKIIKIIKMFQII